MVLLYLIFYCVVALHFVSNYATLPDSIPVHFSKYAEPDRWMDKDTFALYHWGFVFFLSGIFAGAAALIRRLPPKMINIPNKDYWMATPERVKVIMTVITEALCILGVITAACVVGVDHLIMKAARLGARRAEIGSITTVVTVTTVATCFVLFRMILKFRRPPDVE